MAISTYSELKTAVARWIDRTDMDDRIPEFIALAEAQMNRRLRVRHMISRATATISDEYSAVPDDFMGVRTFLLSDRQLEFLDQADIHKLAAEDTSTGEPRFYSVVGGEFRFYPSPDSAYSSELAYWAKIPALSNSNTSNWVLSSHPDAYLYGSLLQAAPYMRDNEQAQVWSSGFDAAIEGIITADVSEGYGDRRRLRRAGFN